MSDFLTLDIKDAAKGLVVAVFTAIITWLYSIVMDPSFAFSMITLDAVLKVSTIAMVAYLFKNFITTGDGKVLGFIG